MNDGKNKRVKDFCIDFVDFSVFSFFYFLHSTCAELIYKDRKDSEIHKMRNEEGKYVLVTWVKL